ncbi:MAG: hypothetical protein KJ041_08710 [Gammaproteobacteria bacterium]|nr:hypothetical protein [Gammaproteobacteria bacterium]
MRHRSARFLSARLLAPLVLLAACGQTPPEQPQGSAVTMTTTHADGDPLPLGAALVMSDFVPVIAAQGTVVEFVPGWFMGPVSGIGADGTVTVRLPDPDDVPASTLASPLEFLHYIDLEGCTVLASDLDARVSKTGFDIASTPGMAILTAEGAWPAVVTDADFSEVELPEGLEDHVFVTWLYADRPVTIRTGPGSGLTLCEVATDVYFGLDVSLQSGWNQLGWSLDLSETTFDLVTFTLENDAAQDLYLNQSSFIATLRPSEEVTP